MSQDDQERNSSDFAEKRTDWAEDRTILASERTFAGWARTGLASAGLGLGFQAVFKAVEPTYLAKSVATIFIVISILIFYGAFHNASKLARRLNVHAVEPIKVWRLRVLMMLFVAGDIALGVVLWVL